MELRDDFEEQFLASTDSNTSANDSDNDSDNDSAAGSTRSEKESQLEPVQVQFTYHKWDKVQQCYSEATGRRTFELQVVYTSSDEEEWLPTVEGQPAVEAEDEDMEEEEMYTTPHANLCVSPTNPPFSSSMTGQLNIEPAVSRQLGYRAAALKMEPPQKFKGDGGVSPEDWRLKICNYCKITGVDQHPDTHTAVVCSLLGEEL